MEKYLIILDLDGTIMLGYHDYDKETFDYLRKLKEAGHIIMIATGRPFRSSYFIYEILGLDTPLVNYNGAYISNPADPNFPITDLRIAKEDLLAIIQEIKDGLINVFCEIYDNIYAHEDNEQVHDYFHVEGGKLHVGPLESILPGDPHGALVFVKPEYVERMTSFIQEKYPNQILSCYWHVNEFDIVEIYNPLVDKALGLKQAMDYYGIDKKHTIAIGDGHNDIGMFQVSGISVAMGNAHKDLFPHASEIAKNHDEQGVLQFLQAFFKI